MKTRLIRIGNSRGIRIPRIVLELCHLRDEVQLEVVNDSLIVRPVKKPRSGWEDAFREMHQQGDDSLLDKESLLQTQRERTK